MSSKCNVCSRDSRLQCSACFSVYYCGQEHQRQDWKQGHKATCQRPYKILRDPDVGRFMVAARDLRPGDVILKERPVVVGPNLLASSPLCLGCHKPIVAGAFWPCKQCKLPFCSEACSVHKAKDECGIFKRDPEVFYKQVTNDGRKAKGSCKKSLDLTLANYQIVLPIRVLLLKVTKIMN